MADVFSKKRRSQVMSRIRSKDTKPEMKIRRGLHRLGYRYRLHVKDLPGKPDLVFPRYKTVVQVRGCFWHGHECIDGHIPKSREKYWRPKLARTMERDRENDQQLREQGWQVIVVWECDCSSQLKLSQQLNRIHEVLKFPSAKGPSPRIIPSLTKVKGKGVKPGASPGPPACV